MTKVALQEKLDLCFCGQQTWQLLFHYDTPPIGETPFSLGDKKYQRNIMQCKNCGHCQAAHNLDLEKLYEGSYVSATYGNSLRQTYDRIMALPSEQSDNAGRVAQLTTWLGAGRGRRVLDVGSGLCVFLARMQTAGWQGTALDPDARAVRHAQEVVGIPAIKADWLAAEVESGQYDLVTFNKVLEHNVDLVPFLAKAASALAPGGHVYIEVPDGEAAAAAGSGREEFFVEHWHAFSPLSLLHLIRSAGFTVRKIERLREPSGKYTLRALAYVNLG